VLETRLKNQAHALGFELVGIAPATEADGFERLQEWLARGYAGEMAYMQRRAEARRHPDSIFPDVRSVIMLGLGYGTSCAEEPDCANVPMARIARYARGEDYHTVLWRKLDELLHWLQQELPECRGRSVVDTAPLLERDFARRAGLGWIGKNTLLINKYRGSFLYLGALLVDVDLTPDAPHAASHCGTCTACLDACPTQAFTGPGWLDARRCISYLTIELRSPVHEELRAGIGSWLFGCDICQEVCPWNHKSETTSASAVDLVDPAELLGLSDEQFRKRFRGTAMMRPKRAGLLRNAALVLGNIGSAEALPALRQALGDSEPMIREAAGWAIEQICGRIARSAPVGEDFAVAKAPATL